MRSGGAFMMYMAFNGITNVKLIFKEEQSGGTITAYGGLADDEYTRGNTAGKERMNIINVGTIGDSGSSLFWTFNGPVSIAQAANVVAGTNSVAAYTNYANAQLYNSKDNITYLPFGFSPAPAGA